MDAAVEMAVRALGYGTRAAEKRKAYMADLSAEARDELIRSGVPPDFARADNPLILGAVSAYICSHMATGRDAERMAALWETRLDSLRKSPTYTGGERNGI